MSFSLKFPDSSLWKNPNFDTAVPPSPFSNELLTKLFEASMHVLTPLTIAIVYFTTVHYVNPIVRQRQLRQAGIDPLKPGKKPAKAPRLQAAPYAIAKLGIFKLLVLLHNVFLCVYSVWTFVGMLKAFSHTTHQIRAWTNSTSALTNFVHAVCDLEHGVFQQTVGNHNLALYGWWFYMLKFYEVLDTVIILLKGRPSSLLQSYHHAGAMMCMWSGIRYQSPPIWIFVVFNSFIHLLMYFYFSLACLKVKVPQIVKRVLTLMQISQFILGGSLAVFHAFITLSDVSGQLFSGCIKTSDQALPLLINVAYLAPLTALFATFYIESYIKRKTA